MKWTDVQEIGIQLSEAHPDVNPEKVNFVDLMRWVMALPAVSYTHLTLPTKRIV